jgi:hypothetical protein
LFTHSLVWEMNKEHSFENNLDDRFTLGTAS